MKAKTKISSNTPKNANFFLSLQHWLKMIFVPHKKNGYRPHVIRSYGLVAVIFIVLGIQAGYNLAVTGSVLGRQTTITVSSLLKSTNDARELAGQLPLSINEQLNQAAYLKAQDMFAKQYWAHDAPDGTKPWSFFGSVGYNYDTAGENLAKNFASTSAVMTAWLNSPEHKANIVSSDYVDVGFAIVSGDIDSESTSIVVALYGKPISVLGYSSNSFSDAKSSGQFSILSQFSVAVQSLTPIASLGLVIILAAFLSAAMAHKHRHKLPKKLRLSWYRHHGLYKATGLAIFALILLFAYAGGQI